MSAAKMFLFLEGFVKKKPRYLDNLEIFGPEVHVVGSSCVHLKESCYSGERRRFC